MEDFMVRLATSLMGIAFCLGIYAQDPLQKLNLPKQFSDNNGIDRFTITDRVWPESVGAADVCLWPDDKMAAVSFAIDDGDAANIDWWLEQMESRGWRMTWNMIVDYANRRFSTQTFGSWDDYRRIFARGHEVASHTYTHGHCSDPAAPYFCPIDTSLDTSKTSCCNIDNEYSRSQQDVRDSISGDPCLTMAYSGHDPYQPYVHAGDTTWYLSYAHNPSVAANYYIACRGTTGRPNKANRISYLSTYCGVADDTSWIENIITRNPNEWRFWRGWNIALWHGIVDTNVHKEYFNFIKRHEADLWVATFVDAAKYGEERDTKTLTVTEVTARHITFTVIDSMKDSSFDFPLTVKVRINNAWNTVFASQNGHSVAAAIIEHNGNRYALVKAVPDRGAVELAGATAVIVADRAMTEANLDARKITVTLDGAAFVDPMLIPGNFSFVNAPAGCTVEGVTYTNATTCVVDLGFDGTDFDSDLTNLNLTIAADELSIGSSMYLASGLSITATDDAESISIAGVGTITEGAEDGAIITVTLSGGTFGEAITPANWTLANLPAGVSKGLVRRVDVKHVSISLSGNRTADYDTNITNLTVTCSANEYRDATGGGALSATSGVTFIAIVEPPEAPTLASPADNALGVELNHALTWNRVSGATTYHLQLSTVPDFVNLIVNDSSISTVSMTVSPFSSSTLYYWRVRAKNAGGESPWSSSWSFSTVKQSAIPVNRGWNMISLNTHLKDSSASAVFDSISGRILVKNNAGLVYWPAYGINTIGSVRTGEGYKVYSDSSDTIWAFGTPIDVAVTPIQLSAGWNMIGYLPQSEMPIGNALGGVASQITIVKNNAGHIYWPDYGVNTIGNMRIGEGYKAHMKNAAVLTYPSGGISKLPAEGTVFSTPRLPKHFLFKHNSGNNMTILVKQVSVNGTPAADNGEIGVFDENGNCVGSGVVMKGKAAFSVWGDDPQTKEKDGCAAQEKMTFKLWNGIQEYPIEYQNDALAAYQEDRIFAGTFSVPERLFILKFALKNVYPNPFRNRIAIMFDVPGMNGKEMRDVEINIYGIDGRLIHQIVRGKYEAGHHSAIWNVGEGVSPGSNVYIVRMKAANFDNKRRLFRLK